MYCIFNATTFYNSNTGNPLGWPFEQHYGYFCDQRDKNLFVLSNGLLNIILFVGTYLLAVLYLGPRLMANRKPLEVKPFIRLYNLLMILVNVYLIAQAPVLIDNGRKLFKCEAVEVDFEHINETAQVAELFLLSRFADFLDTIWFVLRKKQSHVTFLHVFHHTYVPSVVYLGSRWVSIMPWTMALPFINCIIHVVMYVYYLLATFKSMQRHLWWKKYLTRMQMLQFVLMLAYIIYGYFYFGLRCGKWHTIALASSLATAAIFFLLFYSFYQKAYVKSIAKQQQQQKHQSGRLTALQGLPSRVEMRKSQ